MRSPTNFKEVGQLSGRPVALLCSLSCEDDKDFLFFSTLKMKERFKWTIECKEDFSKVKSFFTLPLILTRPREESLLLLYFSVTDQALSSVLFQDMDKVDRPVFFIRKVFIGTETKYQNIES